MVARLKQVDALRINVNAIDEPVFLHDRASHVVITTQPLPAAERREEFRVSWTPATVATVKFQYRQTNLPNTIQVQTFAATGTRETIFRVQGDDFVKGGPVSAWRVSLWTDTFSCVAEQRSAIW